MSTQASPVIVPAPAPGMVEHRTRSGIIRLGQVNLHKAPYWLINPDHDRVGLKGSEDNDLVLELNEHDQIVVRGSEVHPDEKVLTIKCNIDETMSEHMIFAGASGSVGYNVIKLWRPKILADGTLGSVAVSPRSNAYFGRNNANIWYEITSSLKT